MHYKCWVEEGWNNVECREVKLLDLYEGYGIGREWGGGGINVHWNRNMIVASFGFFLYVYLVFFGHAILLCLRCFNLIFRNLCVVPISISCFPRFFWLFYFHFYSFSLSLLLFLFFLFFVFCAFSVRFIFHKTTLWFSSSSLCAPESFSLFKLVS